MNVFELSMQTPEALNDFQARKLWVVLVRVSLNLLSHSAKLPNSIFEAWEIFCSQTNFGGCKVSGVVEYQVYDEWRLGKAFGCGKFCSP